MDDSATYISFLIRLWREGSPQQPGLAGQWQGEIEHIQTGQRWTFTNLGELLDLLQRQTESPETLGLPPTE